jgi:hypothetical protein
MAVRRSKVLLSKPGGFVMSRPTNSANWRALAAAARNEHDPNRFMLLLKQLYDVVNTQEEENGADLQAAAPLELNRAA